MRDTSVAAYHSRSDTNKQTLEDIVFDILSEGNKTDEQIFDEVHDKTMYSPSGTRTARKKLETDGKVYDTGLRIKARSGRNAIVWSLQEQTTLF